MCKILRNVLCRITDTVSYQRMCRLFSFCLPPYLRLCSFHFPTMNQFRFLHILVVVAALTLNLLPKFASSICSLHSFYSYFSGDGSTSEHESQMETIPCCPGAPSSSNSSNSSNNISSNSNSNSRTRPKQCQNVGSKAHQPGKVLPNLKAMKKIRRKTQKENKATKKRENRKKTKKKEKK